MGKRRICIIKKYSAEPMSEVEWEATERIMARLIAGAYLADLQTQSRGEVPVAGNDEGTPECPEVPDTM